MISNRPETAGGVARGLRARREVGSRPLSVGRLVGRDSPYGYLSRSVLTLNAYRSSWFQHADVQRLRPRSYGTVSLARTTRTSGRLPADDVGFTDEHTSRSGRIRRPPGLCCGGLQDQRTQASGRYRKTIGQGRVPSDERASKGLRYRSERPGHPLWTRTQDGRYGTACQSRIHL